MYVEQLYTDCLAEAAYYIESNGEAAIIDPLRETEPYIELAEKRGAKIKYIFETHFHADFVSGHIDLAKKTGATIVFGPNAEAGYDIRVAKDEEDFKIGDVTIRVLHTPGHTMESSTYLLLDEQGEKHSIYTGDTLFINDVGRPDLAVKTDLSREDLARHLYDSLHNKIMPLPDSVIVYPGHGAGSACGKNLGKETFDTLGHQKQVNYALQEMTKEEFVQAVTDGLTAPPAYFPMNAKLNKGGYDAIDEVMKRNLKPLSVAAFEKEADDKTLILDTRQPEFFDKGFIPGSMNIGLKGQYAPWVGALIPMGARLLVVAEPGFEEEAVMRLARIGYENVAGYLEGGIDAWKNAGKPVDTVEGVEGKDVADRAGKGAQIIDVRRPAEFEIEHVKGAANFPLMELESRVSELDKDKPYLVHCAGGYRSMIASSILKAHGFKQASNVLGGFKEITGKPGIEIEAGMCPSQKKALERESAKA